MSKERFEVFGNVIKDNEYMPSLLNNYQATVRLNELNDKVKELEQELAELKEKAIVPKFKIGQDIFFIDNECQIAQGVVDVILIGQDVFEKWCKYSIDLGVEYEDDIRFIDKNEEEIFATKEEAQEKLKEIQGNE